MHLIRRFVSQQMQLLIRRSRKENLRPVRAGRSSTRSERTEPDVSAVSAMGMACVRGEESAMAACGLPSGADQLR